jgi:electron transfer flavoprotein beta subunit
VKIAVCIKRVPVMEAKFAIAGDGTRVDETGLKWDVNDFDLWAIEAALQLKEANGNQGEVVAITLGPDAAQEQLRKAMAMGADRGILLQADRAPADGLAVAEALAAELAGGGWDLVLFGRIAIDSMNQMTGPMVAELLGLPCVTNVCKLAVANGAGEAERALEGAAEVVTFPLPLEVKPAALGAANVTQVKAALPPERAAGRILGDSAAAVPELVRLLQTEAKVL